MSALAVLPAMSGSLLASSARAQTAAPSGLLPSWNDGPAKQAIVDFVRATTEQGSPKFVPPAERIATFDQDGTLWVEHPMYSQVMYCLDRVPAVVAKKPELKNVEPFTTVMSGNREAMAKFTMKDLETILAATLTGMPVDDFNAEVTKWRARGIRAGNVPTPSWSISRCSKCCATCATSAGDGARLKMLLLHDDAVREYAYGPAQGLPNSKVGTFTPALYEEAKRKGWSVISMKNDWKRIFAFDERAS